VTSAFEMRFLSAADFSFDASLSLPTPGHVVDEGAINVGAADADRIEKRFEVGDEILLIRKLFTHNLGITGLAEHHQAS